MSHRSYLPVRNCYATTPHRAVGAFPSVRAAEVKGKPHFADFGFLPDNWVDAAARGWPLLEELSFKRMVVTDGCLWTIAASFGNLRVLRLKKCEGFTTAGLTAITQSCRNLRELDLAEDYIDNNSSSQWLTNFPEPFTSLETLNLSCLTGEMSFTVLERLVGRCRNLKKLKLNDDIPVENVTSSLLLKAPEIVELGVGKLSAEYYPDRFDNVKAAFEGCKSLRRLSGGWVSVPDYLPALYSLCEGLTALDLCYATVKSPLLIEFIGRCKHLLRLWVNDFIEDHGLHVVASTCSKLQELRLFPARQFFGYYGEQVLVTERGPVDVSANCPALESILYHSSWMTNEALVTVAKNHPNLTSFRLATIGRCVPDYITKQPFDAGFSAIVESCKGLRRLSIAALLTDDGFKSIGAHADRLEVLSLGDQGLHYILSGCKSLKRLQITGCPFGCEALLDNAAKLETLRYLWMSLCQVTVGGCRRLALQMPRLSVEVTMEPKEPLESLPRELTVDTLYVYRTLASPRLDAPEGVKIASNTI